MSEDTMTLPEYIDAVKDTLKYWLDIHTKAESWARMWNIDEDWQYTLSAHPKIENQYFSFNLLEACAYELAKDTLGDYSKCRKCGWIYERGYDCDNCEKECTGTPTIAELCEWLKDIGAECFTDEQIENAMIKQGFKVYREALKDIIAPVVQEVKDCLKQFKRDELAGVVWANHLMHVHGSILKDYGDYCRLDYDFVCRVSQEGLQAVFGEEAIKELEEVE